ncbi:hypothetical protein Tco_1114280 [Tanacetum coccineum]|uniref:Uncharacterized protein n=1 Tax=Tanacetum coccineum TaxID=301880 RepID=A0ABQ5IUL6_9ASTR
MPNILPTLPTFDPDLDFTPSHDSLGSGNKIFDPGIFIEVQSERLLSWDEFSISFIRDPLSLVFDTLLPFSSENEDKVFNPGIGYQEKDKNKDKADKTEHGIGKSARIRVQRIRKESNQTTSKKDGQKENTPKGRKQAKARVERRKAVKRRRNSKNKEEQAIYRRKRKNMKRRSVSEIGVVKPWPHDESTCTRGIILRSKANVRCLLDRLAEHQESLEDSYYPS